MTEWIPISDVERGDHVRVPGRSSRDYWRDREQAESTAVPFLRVERLRPYEPNPQVYEVVLSDGSVAWLRRDAHVLRRAQ